MHLFGFPELHKRQEVVLPVMQSVKLCLVVGNNSGFTLGRCLVFVEVCEHNCWLDTDTSVVLLLKNVSRNLSIYWKQEKNPLHFSCSHRISLRSPTSSSAALLSWCLHFTRCLSPVLLPSYNCLKVLLVLHDCGVKEDETCWSLAKSAIWHL